MSAYLLGFVGVFGYGIAFLLACVAIDFGARGMSAVYRQFRLRWPRRRPSNVVPLADRRRQQLDAVVHIPHRRAFTKNPRLGKRGEFLWNGQDIRR